MAMFRRLRPQEKARREEPRSKTRITAAGWHYILAIIGVFVWGVMQNANSLLLVGSLMLGLLVVGWWTCRRNVKRLSAQLTVPMETVAGQVCVQSATIRNDKGRHCWALWLHFDAVQTAGPKVGLRVPVWRFITKLPPRRSERVFFTVRYPCRGRYEIQTLEVSSEFPFGLLRHSVSIPIRRQIVVAPVARRTSVAMLSPHMIGHYQGGGRRPGRSSVEFYGVRQWLPGDTSRWIHWRSSAKHGQLVVRQFEQQRHNNLAVLAMLSEHDSAGGGQSKDDLGEAVVSTVAGLFAVLPYSSVGEIALGIAAQDIVWLQGRPSRPLMEQVREALAICTAPVHDRLPELLQTAAERLGGQWQVLLVGPGTGPSPMQERIKACLHSANDPRLYSLVSNLHFLVVGSQCTYHARLTSDISTVVWQHELKAASPSTQIQ